MTYEPHCGQSIDDAALEMVKLARGAGEPVTAIFNDIPLMADVDASPDAVVATFHAQMDEVVRSYRESPEGKEDARRQESRRVAAAAKSEGILPFSVADQVAWDGWVSANTDAYGAATIRYAARWANFFERGRVPVQKGPYFQRRQQRADRMRLDRASFEADLEGITGAMHGFAKAMLRVCWSFSAAIPARRAA